MPGGETVLYYPQGQITRTEKNIGTILEFAKVSILPEQFRKVRETLHFWIVFQQVPIILELLCDRCILNLETGIEMSENARHREISRSCPYFDGFTISTEHHEFVMGLTCFGTAKVDIKSIDFCFGDIYRKQKGLSVGNSINLEVARWFLKRMRNILGSQG